MFDTVYLLPAAQKKLMILYRAATDYRCSSVQSTVRYLTPKVPLCDFAKVMPYHWACACRWWKGLDAEQRLLMDIQYKFAAKVR
jgi:hypothetical protein